MPDKLLHALHLCIPFHHKKEMSTHKNRHFITSKHPCLSQGLTGGSMKTLSSEAIH